MLRKEDADNFIHQAMPDPSGLYPNIRQAMSAVRRLKIKSVGQYRQRYKKDPRLPRSPDLIYRDAWSQIGCWYGFLNKKKVIKNIYPTYQEAKQAAKQLGITSSIQYRLRFREDPLLPAEPNKKYPNEWIKNGRWYGFLDKTKKKYVYYDYHAAKQRVNELRIRNQRMYQIKHHEDPRLPAKPHKKYDRDWIANGRWYGFLGTGEYQVNLYQYAQAAATAAQRLGIKSVREYQERYQEDPRLPAHPEERFQKNWNALGKWRGFLGQRPFQPFKQIARAIKAARELGIKNSKQYQNKYYQHPHLPSHPERYYKNKWPGWSTFLGCNAE